MLTMEELKDMKPGIFATGEAPDGPTGLNMTGSGDMLRWVAVRGGNNDWAVYCHRIHYGIEWIAANGDKVGTNEHIRKCVPCEDEVLARYRR